MLPRCNDWNFLWLCIILYMYRERQQEFQDGWRCPYQGELDCHTSESPACTVLTDRSYCITAPRRCMGTPCPWVLFHAPPLTPELHRSCRVMPTAGLYVPVQHAAVHQPSLLQLHSMPLPCPCPGNLVVLLVSIDVCLLMHVSSVCCTWQSLFCATLLQLCKPTALSQTHDQTTPLHCRSFRGHTGTSLVQLPGASATMILENVRLLGSPNVASWMPPRPNYTDPSGTWVPGSGGAVYPGQGQGGRNGGQGAALAISKWTRCGDGGIKQVAAVTASYVC